MPRPLTSIRLLPFVLTLSLLAPLLSAGASPASEPAPVRSVSPFVSDLRASVDVPVTGQTDSGEPEIGRSSYGSPLGYALEWEDDWDLRRPTASYGLEVAFFENDDDVSVQVWGFMQFGGDADVCIDQMASIYPQLFDIDDFEEARDADDDPVGPGEDVAFATFDYVESPREDTAQRLYLGCQTLVPGESVIVIGVSATESGFAEALDDADAFLDDSLTVDPPTRDVEGFADLTEALSTDIDRFYLRSLRQEGERYTGPEYRTYAEPTDTPCFGPPLEGSEPDRTAPEQLPGVGPTYCGVNQTILVDAPWLLTYIIPQAGDVVLAAILAHEAGHHLQGLTGWNRGFDYGDPKDTFIAEQQADCLSGSYLRSAVLRGIYRDSDLDALRDIIADIGGFEPGVDHGTGEERVDAFDLGYDEGFDACGLFDRQD